MFYLARASGNDPDIGRMARSHTVFRQRQAAVAPRPDPVRIGIALGLTVLVALSLGTPAPVKADTALAAAALTPIPAIALKKRMQGEEAIQALRDRVSEVAAWHGSSTPNFIRRLRQDRHAWLDENARLFYVDDFPLPPDQAQQQTADATLPEVALASLDQTFLLHSRPGARRVMYLDFNGGIVTNSAWNSSYGVSAIDARPFDLDGLPVTFNDTELQRIQNIWRRVAEDYAPFDVDITTEEPLPDAIARSNSNDLDYGTRVLVTRDWTKLTSSPCGCGGVAYVGVFNFTSEAYKPAWVFFDNLANGNEKYVAEAISHEAGHNLGLSHDGYNDGVTTLGYYTGHGTGATGWAPIMGAGYYKELTQWSKGEYTYANETQDDLQLIQNYGAPLRQDDHGNVTADATPLLATTQSGSVSLSGEGLISTRSDVDVFVFDSGPGTITLAINPALAATNLDIAASLYDAAGVELAYSNPVDAVNASINLTGMPSGTYYLAVDGTGKGSPATAYSDYGSLGEYVIDGTVPAAHVAPPVAVASATPVSGTAPLPVSFSGGGSYDPDGDTIHFDWNFGDGSAHSYDANPSHTYAAAGTYTATLLVTDASGDNDQAQINIDVTGIPTTMRVQRINMRTVLTDTGMRAIAAVKITDTKGVIIPGASVSGSWSGLVSKSINKTTGTDGFARFTSPVATANGTFTFTVTNVAAPGYAYDPAKNKETSDSISW